MRLTLLGCHTRAGAAVGRQGGPSKRHLPPLLQEDQQWHQWSSLFAASAVCTHETAGPGPHLGSAGAAAAGCTQRSLHLCSQLSPRVHQRLIQEQHHMAGSLRRCFRGQWLCARRGRHRPGAGRRVQWRPRKHVEHGEARGGGERRAAVVHLQASASASPRAIRCVLCVARHATHMKVARQLRSRCRWRPCAAPPPRPRPRG